MYCSDKINQTTFMKNCILASPNRPKFTFVLQGPFNFWQNLSKIQFILPIFFSLHKLQVYVFINVRKWLLTKLLWKKAAIFYFLLNRQWNGGPLNNYRKLQKKKHVLSIFKLEDILLFTASRICTSGYFMVTSQRYII